MRALRLAAAALLAAAVAPAVARAAEGPRTIAFVVGVEKYDERNLDQLRYVAEDADRVWEALKTLTNLDEARSKRLVGDARDAEGRSVDAPRAVHVDEIRAELEKFLAAVEDKDVVVLYFGGHGAVKKGVKDVAFLASNFQRAGFANRLFMSDVLKEVNRGVTDKVNVQVVVLANMCHAAALAPGAMGGDEERLSMDQFKQLSESYMKGVKDLAYIPAAQPEEQTYESKENGGSVFARYLLEALRGAAATNQATVTTGSVLAFLQKKLAPPPPAPANFEASIVLRNVGAQEAEERYWLGVGLLSAALDVLDRDLDRRYLLRLAAHQLRRAGGLAQAWHARAALAEAQCLVLQSEDFARVDALLKAAAEDDGAAEDVRNAAARLRQTPEAMVSTDFHALVLAAPSDALDASGDDWMRALKSLPGARQAVSLPLSTMAMTTARDVLTKAEEQVARFNDNSRSGLVLVYSGVAGTNDAGELTPLSADQLWRIRRAFRGPAVVIFDAPFGGRIKASLPPDLALTTSLWLAAAQDDGMTFSRTPPRGGSAGQPSGGTTELMLAAAADGLSAERLDKLRREQSDPRFTAILGSAPEFTLGQSEWIGEPRPPFWRGLANVNTAFQDQLLDWYWWPEQVLPAEAKAPDDPGWPTRWYLRQLEQQVRHGNWELATRLLNPDSAKPNPWRALRLGALQDVRGRQAEAVSAYNVFLGWLQPLLARPPAQGEDVQPRLQAGIRGGLKELDARVRRRLAALTTAATRRIHLVAVAAQDYVSPRIPDLALANADAAAWTATLKELYGPRLVVHAVPAPATAAAVLRTFEEAVRAVGANDVLFFVFSGRGFERNGERYLATVDAASAGEDDEDELAGVALGTLARMAGTVPLVAVLDAQLSPTRAEEGDAEGDIFDKYAWFPARFSLPARLASIPALTPQAPDLRTLAAPIAAAGPTSTSAEATRLHVYVWWEGRLTEAEERAAPFGFRRRAETRNTGEGDRTPRLSPLTTVLLQALREQPEGTYRSWIESARARLTGLPGGPMVLQGPAEWPALQRGLDDVMYLLHQADRRQSNIEMALAVMAAHPGSWSQPADRLTRAALLVTLCEELRAWAATTTANDRILASARARSADAVADIEALLAERAALRQDKLMESYLYWASRAYDDGEDNPDGALDFLRKQDLEDLASETILNQLVHVTERAISRTAADRLERTRSLLRQLDREDRPWVTSKRLSVEIFMRQAQRTAEGPRPIVPVEEPEKRP
jgi:uncharacterized caspase-like protein